MRCQSFVRILTCCLLVVGWTTVVAAAEWKPHVVRQFNGAAAEIHVPAKLQILSERWNRVVAVPYLVYMTEKDRLLMLTCCDYPHQAMVMSSDDRGTTWTKPRYLHVDAQGKPDTGLCTGLTYLGRGKLLAFGSDRRWFSCDYGATWGDPSPLGPTPDRKTWNVWDPMLVERDGATAAAIRLTETGYAAVGPGHQRGYLRFSADEGRTWSNAAGPPQWEKVSEVALLRAQNGDWVAACRTDIPVRFKGKTLDHYEGLGISLSKDRGATWSEVQKLYDWGRHHPSLLLMPNHDIVMTYTITARPGTSITVIYSIRGWGTESERAKMRIGPALKPGGPVARPRPPFFCRGTSFSPRSARDTDHNRDPATFQPQET